MVPCCVKGLSYDHISLLCPLPLPIPPILWTSDGLYPGDSQINPSSSHLSSGIYPVPWNCPIDIIPPTFYAIPNTVAKTKFLFCFNLSNYSFTLWKTPSSILMSMLETGVTWLLFLLLPSPPSSFYPLPTRSCYTCAQCLEPCSVPLKTHALFPPHLRIMCLCPWSPALSLLAWLPHLSQLGGDASFSGKSFPPHKYSLETPSMCPHVANFFFYHRTVYFNYLFVCCLTRL